MSAKNEYVYVFFYIKAVNRISMKDSTFHVIYHQYLQWYPSKNELELFQSNQIDDIVIPRLLPSNTVEILLEEEEVRGSKQPLHLLNKSNHTRDIWGKKIILPTEEPLLAISRKYEAVISSNVQLQDYPFDMQHLHIFFEATSQSLKILPTIIYDKILVLEFGALASDPDYKFHKPVVEINEFGEYANTYSCCTITLKLERKFTGILYRIFLPCFTLSFLEFSIFFINYDDIADRLSVLFTLILALIAFLYVASNDTPPIPYLTMTDKYITLCFVSSSAITVYVCIAGLNTIITTVDLDSFIGWIFFGIWGIFQIIFIIYAFYVWNKNKFTLSKSYSELSEEGLLIQESTDIKVYSSETKVLCPLNNLEKGININNISNNNNSKDSFSQANSPLKLLSPISFGSKIDDTEHPLLLNIKDNDNNSNRSNINHHPHRNSYHKTNNNNNNKTYKNFISENPCVCN